MKEVFGDRIMKNYAKIDCVSSCRPGLPGGVLAMSFRFDVAFCRWCSSSIFPWHA